MSNQVEYLTETEVHNLTKLAHSTLRNWRHKRVGICYVKCGRCIRYRLQDVLDWMESQKIDFGAMLK